MERRADFIRHCLAIRNVRQANAHGNRCRRSFDIADATHQPEGVVTAALMGIATILKRDARE
jgi:hypothetical protein